MKVINKLPIGLYKPEDWRAAGALEEILKKCNEFALNRMLDTLWAPDGMTEGDWDKFLINEKDHIIARFGKDYYTDDDTRGYVTRAHNE